MLIDTDDSDLDLEVDSEDIDIGDNIDDDLDISDKDIDSLKEKADDIERSNDNEISFMGKKICATRHGCQGATNCDYAYGSYPG